MKVAVIGPGAMGCLFAGLLARSGNEVWLLDRSAERAARIARDGILIDGIGGQTHLDVRASTDPADVGRVDTVFVWVKAYDTQQALKSVPAMLSDKTPVVSLQNGMGNLEAIVSAVGRRRAVAGVTSYGATLMAEGEIRHTGVGDTVIGTVDDSAAGSLLTVRELLTASGIQVRTSHDIHGTIWGKLLVNAAINPLTALTRLTNGQLLERDDTRSLLDRVARECAQIASAAGIALEDGDPAQRVRVVCEKTAENRSSMLQDILRGRKTEIDAINGSIVSKAKQIGAHAHLNELLTGLVRALQSSSLRSGTEDPGAFA